MPWGPTGRKRSNTKRVTSIEPQSRAGSRRVNVFLDGSFGFSLGEDLAARLSPGAVLSDLELEDLQRQDSMAQVYTAALNLLSYRARSVSELRARLLRRRFDPSLIEQVLVRLGDERILDDHEFAQYWVENRQAYNPRGGRLLQAELRAKGVDRETIDEVLPPPEDEEESAYRVAKRKARSLQGLGWREFRQRAGDHLIRRGFSYEVAASTVRRLWNETNGPEMVSEPDWEEGDDT